MESIYCINKVIVLSLSRARDWVWEHRNITECTALSFFSYSCLRLDLSNEFGQFNLILVVAWVA